ncbi:MAG: TolC family protein [Acidobacteriota bacterium]
MHFKPANIRIALLAAVLVSCFLVAAGMAQVPNVSPGTSAATYVDQVAGFTEDKAVALAIENNGELQALRKEVDASRSMVKQAGLRPNPKVSFDGTKQIGGKDNMQTAGAMLPLELGGRRGARIAVAQREFEAHEFEFANQERLLAANVRLKFGEALAVAFKLEVTEKTLTAAKEGYELVTARVAEGKIAPLEQNIFLVEVNRLQSVREMAEGNVEAAMLELRNMIGMRPEEPLRLKGMFTDLIATLPPLSDSTANAIRDRPDLKGARTVEQLALARIEQARSDGRLDASLKGGFQRNEMGFPVSGFDANGFLSPVHSVFNAFTFGIEIDLPVRNRNQGAIEAAMFERDAARRRAEFGELSIRRDVATAFARYNRSARSLSIFQNGVRDQANANLQVIWQTYELGARSLLDYINEERRFLDVENELIDAKFEASAARIEILKATAAPELTKK